MSALAASFDTLDQPSIKTIIFGGELGRRFGRVHKFACSTPSEAIRSLTTLIDGLEKFLVESPLRYKIFVDHRGIRDAETELVTNHGATQYAVMPVLEGSKNMGLTQILIGAALIALSFTPMGVYSLPMLGSGATLGGAMMMMGASMVIGGAISLLMGTRTPTVSESNADNNPSYFLNGAVNTSAPGQCAPVGYGELIVGSAVVAVDITTIDIAVG